MEGELFLFSRLYFYDVPNQGDFDEIRFSYYNYRDKRKILSLKKIDNCWNEAKNKMNEDWGLL